METSVRISNIFLCPGTTFESAGQCLRRGYAAVCTHTPRSNRRGVSILKTQLTATRNTLGQEDSSCKSGDVLKRLLIFVLALQTRQATDVTEKLV